MDKVEAGVRVEAERAAAVQASIARGRQTVAAEVQRWYKLAPFRRLPGTSLVCNVVLPDSGHYESVEPAALTAAVAHVLDVAGVLAQVLDVCLPVRWRLLGARSAIWRTGDGVEHSLFFATPTARAPALDLVDDAVCALCASQGVAVAPADTHRLLPNLAALVAALVAPTARYWLCEFRCAAPASAARRVLSTVTPAPAAPLYTDVVSSSDDDDGNEDEGSQCTVRIAAADRDAVCAARRVLWANLRAPGDAEEEPRAVDMFGCTLRLTGAGGVPGATVAAEAAAAFRACVAAAGGGVRAGPARPLLRCVAADSAADSVPAVACIAGSEQAVRAVAAQLRTRLHQYIAGSSVTTAAPSPCAPTHTSIRARARSVPTQNTAAAAAVPFLQRGGCNDGGDDDDDGNV